MVQIAVAPLEVEIDGSSKVPAYACVFNTRGFFNDELDYIPPGNPERMAGGWYRRVEVTNSGGITTVPAFTGANALDWTYQSASGNNKSEYILGLYTASGGLIRILFTGIQVPDSLSPTTWSTLHTFSIDAEPQPMRRDYFDKYEILELLSNLDQFQLGDKNEIEVVTPTNWEVIQPNLVIMKDDTVYRHSSSFASLAAIATAAAADPSNIWVVTLDETETAVNGSHPPNLFLDFSKGFGLSIAAGQAININTPLNTPGYRMFQGLGRVNIQRSAGLRSIPGILWCDDGIASPATISQAQWQGMIASSENNYGCLLQLPQGEYNYTYEPQVTNATIEGCGSTPNIEGTLLVPQTAGQAAFRVMPAARSCRFDKMVIELGLGSTRSGFEVRAAFGVDASIHGLHIGRQLVVNNGKYGVYCNDTSGAKSYLFNEVVIEKGAHFINQSDACFYGNSVNTSYTINCEGFTPSSNGQAWAVDLPSCGKTEITGNANGTYAGNTDPYTAGTEVATFTPGDVAGSVITKAGHGFFTGDPLYVNSSGALMTGFTLDVLYYARERSVTTFSIHPTLADAEADTNAISPTGGSGTQTAWFGHETERFVVVPGDIDTGTNRITATAHGLTTGDSVRVEPNTGGTLPTASNFDFSDKAKCWVQVIDANTIKLHLNGNGASADGDTIDITATGSGWFKFYSTRPNAAVASQRPAGFVRLGGNYSANVKIHDVQDEGIPVFLKITDDAIFGAENYAPTVTCDSVFTQGQTYIEANVKVNFIGGEILADSVHDKYTKSPRIRFMGTGFYTYGVGGPVLNRSGLEVEPPYRFDDFQGGGVVSFGDLDGDGTIIARYGNDVDLGGYEVQTNANIGRITRKLQRLGSGLLTGWWKWLSSQWDSTPSEVGNYLQGGLAYDGLLLNGQTPVGVTTPPGSISMDLSRGNHFIATLNANCTLDFTNGRTGFQHLVVLRMVTSGTTSYALTAGTNVTLVNTFNSGTTSGVYQTLFFLYDGSLGTPKLIEIGRNPTDMPSGYTVVSGTTVSLAAFDKLLLTNTGLVTCTLPATMVVGEPIELAAVGGIRVAQRAGQYIVWDLGADVVGTNRTTTGVGGYIEAGTDERPSVKIVCVEADIGFMVTDAKGDWDLV